VAEDGHLGTTGCKRGLGVQGENQVVGYKGFAELLPVREFECRQNRRGARKAFPREPWFTGGQRKLGKGEVEMATFCGLLRLHEWSLHFSLEGG